MLILHSNTNAMATTRKHKKNLIVSYKNLPDEAKEMFKELYPDGYSNHLTKFTKPNGEPIFVVPLDTEDTSYMVKFDVRIDPMGDDLDKALFDDEEEKEDDYAPLSEVIEKEEGTSHRERVLRHGDFESSIQDEEHKAKMTLGINKEEIKAAFGEDENADELDSYEKIGDEEDGSDDEFEPTDDDLRDIEAEYLEAENPPLDATIPEEEQVHTKSASKKAKTPKTSSAKPSGTKSAKSKKTQK